MVGTRKTRPISWVKAAQKAFEDFPIDVQQDALAALTIVADNFGDAPLNSGEILGCL